MMENRDSDLRPLNEDIQVSTFSFPGLFSQVSEPPRGLTPPWARISTVSAPRSREDTRTAQITQEIVEHHLGGQFDRVVVARQIHGAQVVKMDAKGNGNTHPPQVLSAGECDGLWTREEGLCLVIRTADCAPVVLWDEKIPRLAVVHSGWRGTLKNIVGETVRILMEDGAALEDLNVWIGPTIMRPNFPVGMEVIRAFSDRWPEWGSLWQDGQLDIPGVLRRQCLEAGVSGDHVCFSGICTFSAPRGLPSHRREGDSRQRSLFTLAGITGITQWK